MKLVVQVKLLPMPEQAATLEATLRACNMASCDVAVVARKTQIYRNYDLRKHVYTRIKADYAQAAQHVIKKVADAYTTVTANLKAGTYGKPGSKRRQRVETNPVGFRWDAAQPYDARMLSWQADARTVSIWTTAGRLRGVAYTGSADQFKTVATSKIGESDLVHRNGMWFLYTSVEVPEPDLINPARVPGRRPGHHQHRLRFRRHPVCRRQAQRLPPAATAAAPAVAGQGAPSRPSGCWPGARSKKKETRHAAHINHTIAKTIVTEAERTGRGIAVEELTGIRDRVRLRKPQRVTLSSWSFHQLGSFLAYKARRAGVSLVQVDPRYTSQTCHGCGHRDKRNRPDQETFICRSCGVVAHADHNAALNIAQRGVECWGAVNRPHAAPLRSQRRG